MRDKGRRMINRDVLDYMYQYTGIGENSDSVTLKEIRDIEKEMGVTLPDAYIKLILEYGGIDGGICQHIAIAKEQTKSFREKYNIPNHFFEHAIGRWCKDKPRGQYILFWDTSRMKDGDCPSVMYSCDTNEYWDYAANAEETINKRIEESYNYMFFDNNNPFKVKKLRGKESITGIGVHTCSALVNNSSQKDIAQMLNLQNVKTMPHREALEIVRSKSSYAMITPEFMGSNFVIFSQSNSVQLMDRNFAENAFSNAPFVYMLSTMYCGERHGYMILENGKCKRIQMMISTRYDENVIMGEALPEEIKVAKRFPSYREPWQYESIISLMTEFVSFKKNKYPYEDVLVGTIDIDELLGERMEPEGNANVEKITRDTLNEIITDSQEAESNLSDCAEDILLPKGFGYKSAFLLTNNFVPEDVLNQLVSAEKYDTDVAYIEKSKKVTFVKSDIIINFFLGDKEKLVKILESFSSVNLFITDRISESHGFAVIERGEIKRFYINSEESMENIGDRTDYEKDNNMLFPSNYDEARDRTGKYTDINEDIVIEMASEICKFKLA